MLIVEGSQQALDLAARVLLDPGDAVWLEEPGYWGARRAFHAAEARLVPVPVDDGGLNVEAGIARCRAARLAYVTPSHQYPLGTTMSLERRLALLSWARRTDAWIIEDDYDSEYRYTGPPITALQGLDDDGRVVYRAEYVFPVGGAWRHYMRFGPGQAGFSSGGYIDITDEPGAVDRATATFRSGLRRARAYVQPLGYAAFGVMAALAIAGIVAVLLEFCISNGK